MSRFASGQSRRACFVARGDAGHVAHFVAAPGPACFNAGAICASFIAWPWCPLAHMMTNFSADEADYFGVEITIVEMRKGRHLYFGSGEFFVSLM
ncbi:hypothetical protein [Burkholderia cenocepacia]|uniref:hypothetical protein n=1 Tax=Burkholderia cenocepacia TaxID=95486 RepID=UPI002AB153CB|nr:hypothetical protein [Burkholderia cenocepacia]